MKNILFTISLLCGCCCLAPNLHAQNVNCSDGTVTGTETYSGTVFFNYGSITNSISLKNRTTTSVGETFIGDYFGQQFNGVAGFYSRFLLPPTPPQVTATEGDLEDRIQIEWTVDPLSPSPELGFNIYRDNAFIGHVDKEIRIFVDFNVQAGKFYNYQVTGVNSFGEGRRGSGLGFLNPNGIVTGQVKTFNGSPVVDAEITLTPTLGTALEFGGDDMAFAPFDSAFLSPKWSVSCWVKIGAGNPAAGGAILDFGSPVNKNWWLTTNGAAKGVRFNVGAQSLAHNFATNPDGWHHVAATYSGTSLLLYVDGALTGTVTAPISTDTLPLFFGRRPNGASNFFTGNLDDVRMFNRQLSQTEINQFKNRTVNADANGLAAYWKLDEGVGSKAYDISPNDLKIYLCGPGWTADRPDVVNGAVTDETGFYKIEGINYGAGTIFTATPSKKVFNNYALEFNAANSEYAVLTDSVLLGAQNASLEMWVQNFENTAGFRTLLANEAGTGTPVFLRFNLTNGDISMNMAGVTKTFGPLGAGYRHIVVNMAKNGATTDVSVYNNGTLVSTQNYAVAMPNFGLQTWQVGARKTATGNDQFFSGLMDEVAFYDTLLTLPEIQLNYANGVNPTHPRLRSWFSFNESRGTEIEDIGQARTGKGTVHGALWSSVTGITSALMHQFQPDKQLVTLNASNTSTDKIDFTDLSTVAVTGFVRYDGTNCFAEGVEILVNGSSNIPPVFTNSEGRFVVDLEPGASATLSPKFKNHTFAPASWQVSNVVSPVAGILFRNLTKRSVRGKLVGNDRCRRSIIESTAIVKMKVETLDECFSREIILNDPINNLIDTSGKFFFDNLPPIPMTVKLTEHSNGTILNYFSGPAGAPTTDLTEKSDTVDFIYYSKPEIEISMLDTNQCGQQMLEQSDKYVLDFRVFQPYHGGVCYLDTAELRIDNELADLPSYDTLMTEGKLRYRFTAGQPNLVPPHLKTLTVLAMADGEDNTTTTSAVVLGKRPRNINFASTTPEIPILILRDPPGDASSAFIEKGKTVCNGWSINAASSVAGTDETTVAIGLETEIATGIGVEKTFKVDVTNSSTFGVTGTVASSVTESMETCVTANELISTSDGDGIIGDDADVYMGGALNLLFGITDDLRFDSLACNYYRDTGVVVFPEKFLTTFIYTDDQIRNVVIPNLDGIGDTTSANAWRNILALNEDLKEKAAFERNFSFDAGVVYENSTTTETTKSQAIGIAVEVSNTIAEELGLEVDGIGVTQTFALELTFGVETEFSDATTNALTVGYTFSDDDIGDNYTVDVKQDKVYGTPVFKTISGNTSCPYEPNTVPRDGVNMTVNQTAIANISANAPAVFRFTIGNISQTDEEREYVLALNPASNPDGAVVNIQGLGASVPFSLEPFGNQEVIVTVERGPVAYDYVDLEFVLYSACEGIGSDDPNLAKTIKVSAFYIEPCSPIDISSPTQNWVQTPADGNTMFITLNDYDRTDPDLELIRVQYRRTQGDGIWINITDVPKADLDPVFEIVQWNTGILKDGLYEIRAITQCFGSQNAGISHVIQGKFEREPPEIFGAPEPADGVLSPGDEISITFTEPIRCDQIIPADFFNNNNVGLYDVATNTLIDAVITCSGDKIIIVPNVPNQFIDNKFLRVEVNDIRDLAGNNFTGAEWEFFVDRNLLDFEGSNVDVTMYEGEEKVVLRTLTNVGGAIATFRISGSPSVPAIPDPLPVPDWFNVFPNIGSLLPGEEVAITFKFDNNLPQGLYRDTIYFNNAQGDERVIVNLRVLCPPPDWDFDPGTYPHSMNMTAKLNIEGDLSEDEEDMVGAFIDGELRGSGHIRYLPALDEYMVFMTIYGDTSDQNKPVNLEIWDASECLRYGEVVEQFTFEVDNVTGTVGNPLILHTNSQVRRDIPLSAGWNWISFNLALPDPALNPALASLEHPENDLIKAQSSFALFFGNEWVGSLNAVNNANMFQYRADVPDTIRMVGGLIDPATVSIPVATGWNWIGYVPNYALPVSTALAGLLPVNGDIIKGQTAFAQYLAGFGWLGSLQFLEPPKGYQLKISAPGTLTYPQQNFAGDIVTARGQPTPVSSHWVVDPAQFEHSMTLVGMLSVNGENATQEQQELGAFAGAELRGAAQAIYIEPLQAYLFFLTAYANAAGEQLTFKLFDGATGQMHELTEKMYFAANLHQGEIEAPVPFTLQTSSLADTEALQFLDVRPNPFGDATSVLFRSKQPQDVQISIADVAGRILLQQKMAAMAGLNAFRLDAGAIPSGLYFVRLESSEGAAVRKVVKE